LIPVRGSQPYHAHRPPQPAGGIGSSRSAAHEAEPTRRRRRLGTHDQHQWPPATSPTLLRCRNRLTTCSTLLSTDANPDRSDCKSTISGGIDPAASYHGRENYGTARLDDTIDSPVPIGRLPNAPLSFARQSGDCHGYAYINRHYRNYFSASFDPNLTG
jgi:hypothetical protein